MARFEGDSEEPEVKFEVVIMPGAALDIGEATLFYEERSEDLLRRFDAALESCLDLIERNPRMFAVLSKNARRGLLRGFSYAVYYQIIEETIYVFAFQHTSRSPKHWKERLKHDFRSNGKA